MKAPKVLETNDVMGKDFLIVNRVIALCLTTRGFIYEKENRNDNVNPVYAPHDRHFQHVRVRERFNNISSCSR